MTTLIKQQAELLKKLIPVAFDRTTSKLNKAIPDLTDGDYQDLDDFFNQTVEKTKFISPVFNTSLARIAKEEGYDYIKEEAVGYDSKCLSSELENKLCLSSNPSQFATGNNHSKSKVQQIFCTKVSQVGNIFPSGFAAIVDLSKASHPDTGWTDTVTKTGKNNHGFSGLQIHIDDVDCITVIHGSIRCHVKDRPNSPTTFVQIDYATFDQ